MSPNLGTTYEEMLNFYASMSLEDFEQYIRNAFEAENNANSVPSLSKLPQNDIQMITSDIYYGPIKQKYYYSGVGYLFITANNVYLDMVSDMRYVDFIEFGYYSGSYPYYAPTTYNTSFSNSMEYLYCSCSCIKYVANNLIATGSYSFNFTFTAGGGDIGYPI